MPKVVVAADIHVAAHGKSADRLEETIKVLNWIYTTALENDIKYVVIVGDLFHDRSYIDVYAYNRVYSTIRSFYDQGIRTVFIIGNHDLFYRNREDVSSVRPFESLGVVIDKPRSFKIDGERCFALPWTEENQVIGLKKMMEKGGYENRVLFAHAAVEGAIMSSVSNMRRKIEPSEVDDGIESDDLTAIMQSEIEGWGLVLLGHYHCPQLVMKSPRVEYVGSPIQHSFGEREESKRILILDLETLKYKEVFNTFSPTFKVISETDEIDFDSLSNCRIRMKVEDRASKATRELRKKLSESGAISVLLDVRKTKKIDTEIHKSTVLNASNWLKDGSLMVRRYAKLQAPGNLDHEKLVKVGDEVIQKAGFL